MSQEKIEHILKKYNVEITEEPDLGIDTASGLAVKGECNTQKREVIIRSDLEPIMKSIVLAHETGHLINYDEIGKFDSNALKMETKAWLAGLPIAYELGIYQEYIDFWKETLDRR